MEEFPKTAYFSFSVPDFDSIKQENKELFSDCYFSNKVKWYSSFQVDDGYLVWYLIPQNIEDLY